MINSIKNIYATPDLNGEFLIQPLKKYHGFFAKKIEESFGLAKAASVIGNVATGIFAYPLLASLSGVGMLVKLMGIFDLRKHNESEKNEIAKIFSDLKNPSSTGLCITDAPTIRGWKMHTDQTFTVNRSAADNNPNKINEDNRLNEINEKIDALSHKFRKVYIQSQQIRTNDNKEAVQIDLVVAEPKEE